MAQLTAQDRKDITAEWMEQMSRAGEGIDASKADVRAMIDAQDVWLDANAAAANQAIPQPARGAITTSGKGRAMTLIIAKRWITGS